MKAIRLQRFKGFIDSGWIEMKPITLLFGYNSSGKSSILHALLMLKQSLENPSLEVPFVFSSKRGVDLGSFEDTVYNHEINHEDPMIISLKIDIGETLTRVKPKGMLLKPEGYRDFTLEDTVVEYSMEISYNKKRRFITIIGFAIKDSNDKIILKMKRANPSQNAKNSFTSEYFKELNKNNNNMKIDWYNFLPVIKDPDFYNHPIAEVVEALRLETILSFNKLFNIGPVRAVPERNQPFTGESPVNVGAQGEEAFKLLYLDKYRNDSKGLETKVNDWLARYHYKFEWQIFRNSLGRFILTDTRSKVKVSIKDVGFGLSQILPIVIQIFDTDSNSTVLVEQPEIHLHPSAQADLADLFIEAVYKKKNDSIGTYSKQNLVIETHSEHLLLRLRRRLAESYLRKKIDGKQQDIKNLEAKSLIEKELLIRFKEERLNLPLNDFEEQFNIGDIAIYFIENIEGKSIANKLELSEKGELLNNSPSFRHFFTDDFEEVFRINNLLANIKKENEEVVVKK